MSSAKNYSQYREHLAHVTPPALPYLGICFWSIQDIANNSSQGVCLSDLTFIEDGNPGEIDKLVNFSKCRQLSAVIRKMLEFQNAPYNLISVPFVQVQRVNMCMIRSH